MLTLNGLEKEVDNNCYIASLPIRMGDDSKGI
jgi:hypothetical protein